MCGGKNLSPLIHVSIVYDRITLSNDKDTTFNYERTERKGVRFVGE